MVALGKPLAPEDVEMILEAVDQRSQNFPDEPRDITFLLVLLNIGERYRSVSCVAGEWVGKKSDISNKTADGTPLCPNGHLLEQGAGVTLGWISQP